MTLGLLLFPAVASAQDALDRAERQLEEAQFEQAAETLSELSESEGPLDRDAVARLLRLRAVVGVALGRDRAVRRDLIALAAVLDGREAGPMPRQLASQLSRARSRVSGPPNIRVRIDADAGGGVRARLRLGDDPGGLTQRTELVCSSGDDELARTEAPDVELGAQSEVVCEATAYGPGGWVMDTAEARRATAEDLGGDGTDFVLPAILGGVGAAVLIGVITGIVIGVTAGRGVGGPMWTP